MAEKQVRERKQTARRVFLDPSTPSNWAVARVVFITFIIWSLSSFLTTLLGSLAYLVFMIFLAIFFAYLIEPLVKIIRQPFKERQLDKIMPRPLAIVIAYIIVFTILGVAIANLAPKAVNQATEFVKNLPNYASTFQERMHDLNTRFESYQIPSEFQTTINAKITSTIDVLGTAITAFLGLLALSIGSYLPWLFLIPILSFFFLKDANMFRLLILRIFPSGRWRARAESLLQDVNTTLAAYTRAQLISCLLIGLICTIGFYIIGLKYTLLLGILAGVLEFIPLIGPITLGLTAILIAAFSDEPWKAVYVAIFLVVLRIIHDYITYPRIIRGGIHLHPLTIILSVLAGEQIAGIPGVFLSIPIVALLSVIYKHVMEHTGSLGIFAGLLKTEEPVKIAKAPVE
ncbi:AI-2E family transporter [soil metagenome]